LYSSQLGIALNLMVMLLAVFKLVMMKMY